MLKTLNEQKRINRYLEQKNHYEFNQNYQRKLKQWRQSEYRDKLAWKLFETLPDIARDEEKCYQNAVQHFAVKWEEQENKRNEHIGNLRRERIKNHLQGFETIKKIEQKSLNEHEVEKAKRQYQEKIDLIFYRQQYANRVQKAKQLRQIINQQIVMNNKARRDQIITSRIETNHAIESAAYKDDKHFFEYANKLIEAAKNKGIPIYPLQKVIDEYTIQNSLHEQTDDLPHMKSQIDIGISLERKYSIK